MFIDTAQYQTATTFVYDSSGKLGLGTATPGAKLDVTDTGTTTSAIIVPRAGNFTGTTVDGMIRYNTSSTLFEFRENGAWVNYTTVSDERLKTNVVPVDQGLYLVNQLNSVFYDWNPNNPKSQGFTKKHQVGFIAQEVEKVLPEVVNKGQAALHNREIASLKAQAQASSAAKDQGIQKLKQENEAFKAYLCAKDPSASFCLITRP